MSWVTAKGPASIIPQTNTESPVEITIEGITIGTAVINNQLVLFTHKEAAEKPDHIYVFTWASKEAHTMNCEELYNGNLGFDINYPIETLVSYEAEHIQKVYWTDNKNQPRMINIKAPDEKIAWWNGDGSKWPNLDTFFDFVPAVELLEKVEITKVNSGGTFSSGVIQYCFTYINKYGQQSNIIYVSPLYYLAHDDRGASPEDIVNNSFIINIRNVDPNFDYLRVYSIQRVATDSVVRVKLLEDIPINDFTTYNSDSEDNPDNPGSDDPYNPNPDNPDTPSGDPYPDIPDHGETDEYSWSWEYNYSEEGTLPPYAPGSGKRIYGVNVEGATPYAMWQSNSEGNYHAGGGYAYTQQFPFMSGMTLQFDTFLLKSNGDRLTLSDIMYDACHDCTYMDYSDVFHYGKFYVWIDVSEGSKMYNFLFNWAVNQGLEYDNNNERRIIYSCVQHFFEGLEHYPYVASNVENAKIIYSLVDHKWHLEYTPDVKDVAYPQSRRNLASPALQSATTRSISYIDNGVTGATIDPTELLFVGGKEIQVFTMADKDGTLFLGNFTQKNTLMNNVQSYFKDNPPIINFTTGSRKKLEFDHTTGFYAHTNQLSKNNREITTFKGGEKYRFGFQLQKHTGEWLEPVFIGDKKNTLYPITSVYSDVAYLPYAYANLDFSSVPNFDSSKYKKIRPVIVFPNISDRQVLCQGVLNPTVFTINDRKNKYPFAQASWFFRPYASNAISDDVPIIEPDTEDDFSYNYEALGTEPSLNLDTLTETNPEYHYVFVATFANAANAMAVLRRGTITLIKKVYNGPDREDMPTTPDQTTTETIEFSAIQILENYNFSEVDSTGLTYAFIINSGCAYTVAHSYDVYEDYQQNDDLTWTKTTYEYEAGIFDRNKPIYATDKSGGFPIYNGLHESNEHLLYYVKPDDSAPDQIHFEFYYIYNETSQGNTYHYYKITFGAMEDIPYQPVSENNEGEYIVSTHYSSLPCQNVEDNKSGYQGSPDYKKIEIQGSYASYDNPYKLKANETEGVSNSQFFIDQSIVTLNSPDIEFDTAVQTYPMENLKLRIIGAIPITGYISAHSIQASSAMLPKGLKKGESTDAGADGILINEGFGVGEVDLNILHENIDIYAGKRLVAEKLWNDVIIRQYRLDEKLPAETYNWHADFMVFPWQHQGSLINDTRREDKAASWLKSKKISHLLFSNETEYFPAKNINSKEYAEISVQLHLTENGQVQTLRLPKQTDAASEINYYPNVEKVIYSKKPYNTVGYYAENLQNTSIHKGDLIVKDSSLYSATSIESTMPVSMKYKSTSHAVIAFNATPGVGLIPILPYAHEAENMGMGIYDTTTGYDKSYETCWGDTMQFAQDHINISSLFTFSGSHVSHSFLWLGELYKDPVNPFGGTGKTAMRNNNWLIGGEAVDFADQVTLTWTEGDTYYQRYDCLKTYPFTVEDQNQIVEILSFMCETRVNIDGRWDRNRGQADNTNMRPDIFNKINEAYTQQDNFFTSRAMDVDDRDKLEYPNQVYYTKTKTSGADVDLWTNMTLATPLELDGDKGKLNSLQRFNDQIIAFQDSGISQILYNENVQISSTQGVPIEIANSGKVQGKRYFSDTIGCSNKWSIANTPMGIYFMDSIGKSIYLFNGQLTPLSFQGGFNTWTKQNIPSASIQWNPTFSEGHNNFVTYYDKMNQDVLFINNETCLAYSERVGAFTSFYNYEDTPYFCNLDDTGIWVRRNDAAETSVLYHHNEGDYCNFFGTNMPYSMTLVGNAEPSTDKIFTNLEFRANSDGEGTSIGSKFIPYVPFDSLESWNEHQHGIANLAYGTGRYATLHHTRDNNAALNRKFRIWRCDIPRDNAPVDTTTENPMGIYRFNTHPLDRMRNPWVYLKLTKKAAEIGETLPRTEIHDILMTYFN
jgi:hypothetical protein